MSWIRTIFQEIWGLFVDDGAFAAAILLWLGLMWFLATRPAFTQPHLSSIHLWSGAILFAGLAAILAESALRYARNSASRGK